MATRRRRMNGQIEDEIRRLAIDSDWSASQIYNDLVGRFKDTPHRRSVERFVLELRPPDPSGTWSFALADPEDAALILPIAAEVLERTEGRHRLTNAEAKEIIRLRRAIPDLPPFKAYQLARLYLSMRELPDLIASLDAAISFEAWRGGEHALRYQKALDAGWLPLNARALGAVAWSMGLDTIPHQVPIEVVSVDGRTGKVSRSRPAKPARKEARSGKARKR